MQKLLIVLATGFLFFVQPLDAQLDAHFTQYYAYPIWLNPALTGVVAGNSRVTAIYRRQLPGLYAPVETKGISGDFVLPGNFGFGITALNQSASDIGYQLSNAYLSLSYQVHLSAYQILSSGFQLGIINRKVDVGKLQFGNQFNPVMGYDASLPSNEIFPYQSATSFDGGIGLMYFDGDPAKPYNPFIGISLFHPTQPNGQFLSGANDNKIPLRYTLHGGIRLQAGNRVEFIPHALFMMQGNTQELAAGIMCNMKIEEGKDLIIGGTYRLNDAIAPTAGLHFNGLTIGLSYDVTVSSLKTAAASKGGYELSISFTHQNKLTEPRFICPRL